MKTAIYVTLCVVAGLGLYAVFAFFSPRASVLTKDRRTEESLQDGVQYKVYTDKAVYGRKDVMTLTIEATNASPSTRTLTFSSGCEVSYKIGNFDYMKGRMCTLVFGTKKLEPGEIKTWTLKHDFSLHDLAPGAYELEALVLGNGRATTSVTLVR